MPFTLSHAAAVLPFRRFRFPWSALVIGSFGPDFEYFLRMNYGSRAWHHYPDVLLFCLPLTVLVYFAFHLFVRSPMRALLPDSFQQRIPTEVNGLPHSLADGFWILAALVLGILTHLLWDLFTHASTWPWKHLEFLRRSYELPLYGGSDGFQLAQAASSVIGLVLLAVFLWQWIRVTPATEPLRDVVPQNRRTATWVGMLALALGGASWRTVTVLGAHRALHVGSLVRLLLVIAGIGCLLWESLIYGVVVTLAGKTKGAHR